MRIVTQASWPAPMSASATADENPPRSVPRASRPALWTGYRARPQEEVFDRARLYENTMSAPVTRASGLRRRAKLASPGCAPVAGQEAYPT